MVRIAYALYAAALMLASPLTARAEYAWWSPYFTPSHVEIGPNGIVLVTALTAQTAPGCDPAFTYAYIQLAPIDSKFADRALATVYFAQGHGKKIRTYITSCSGNIAVATNIWVE